MHQATCGECGTSFRPHYTGSMFCSTPCRQNFHNRRKLRGSQLYDLFMAQRFDRAEAIEAETWKSMCRLAAEYREDDTANRSGRRSWFGLSNPEHVLNRLPYLLAHTVVKARKPKAA